MDTYRKSWGVLPLAIVLAFVLCGAFIAMPQIASADEAADSEAEQVEGAVGETQDEQSGSSQEASEVEGPVEAKDASGAAEESQSKNEASDDAASAKSSEAAKGASGSAKKSPVGVQADGYGIWVHKASETEPVQISSDNASNVLGDGTVVYDNESKTLTLKAAKLHYAKPLGADFPIAGIYINRVDDLTIKLEGESTIVADKETYDAKSVAGLCASNTGKVTITGTGSLKIDAKNTVSTADDVSVYGMWADTGASITVGNNAKVSATAGAAKGTGKSYGVKGTVKVSSLAVLTAIGDTQALESTPDIKDSSVGGALTNTTASASGRAIWDGKQALASDTFKYVRIPGVHHTAAKAATCTAAGNIEYWYDGTDSKYYSDASLKTVVTQDQLVVAALGHSWDEGKVTKAATATKKGVRTYTCTRCKETKTEAIPATGVKYTVTAGANSTWTKGTTATLNFTFKRSEVENNQDTTFKHFTGIKVDGNAVDKSNYTYQTGSVVIKLKPTYLEKLSTGDHTISASFNDYDGTAPSAKFTVKANSNASNTKGASSSTPATGDPIAIIGWVIAGVVAAIVAIIAFRRMRSTDK